MAKQAVEAADDHSSAGDFAGTAALAAQYRGVDDPAVLRFLDTHPQLIPLLGEARPQIDRYFPGSTVFTEIVVDPDADDRPQLVVAIVPRGSPEDALGRYREFQQAWWVPNLRRAAGALVIMPEYR